jgi:hypothetical protein
MRWFQLTWLLAVLVTAAAACSSVTVIHGGRLLPGGSPVLASLQTGGPGFGVRAAPKSVADVSYYVYKLVNVSTGSVAVSAQSNVTSFAFATVPDGTYRLKAEAFSGSSVSLTVGGEQTSSNQATVSTPNVFYSVGTSLAVTIQLLHGTGETIANGVAVLNGNPWSGPPVGAP